MIVHADDVLNAGRLELIPKNSRGGIAVDFHRAGPKRRFLFEEGIVAVIDRFDLDDRLRLAGTDGAAGIIARPFTERSFGP